MQNTAIKYDALVPLSEEALPKVYSQAGSKIGWRMATNGAHIRLVQIMVTSHCVPDCWEITRWL